MKKLFLIAVLLCLVSCNQIYTYGDCKRMKPGDTIYTKIPYKEIIKSVVVKNDTIVRVIEIKRPNYYSTNNAYTISEVLRYSDLP